MDIYTGNKGSRNCGRKTIVWLAGTVLSLVVTLACFTVDVQAADRSWEGDHGANPTQWSLFNNWSGNDVPDSDDIAIIDSYDKDQPVMDVSDEVGELRVNSDETGTITLDINGKTLTVTTSGGLSGNARVYSGGTVDLTNSASQLQTESFQIDSGGTVDGTGSQSSIYCGGSWSDSGTFNIGNTTVVMDATAGTPTITAQNDNDFYDLAVDSTVTVTLSSDIDIDNCLTVQGGKLNVSTYTLTVE